MTPMQVKPRKTGIYYYCPKCNKPMKVADLNNKAIKNKFCPDCGQEVLWDDLEKKIRS